MINKTFKLSIFGSIAHKFIEGKLKEQIHGYRGDISYHGSSGDPYWLSRVRMYSYEK